MDSTVLNALKRWPNVPSAYNWLELNRRGNWLIKGERVTNKNLIDFINRNYQSDQNGRWFFQNGPQKSFVNLEFLPYVVRVSATNPLLLETHTQMAINQIDEVFIDNLGNFIFKWSGLIGSLDDRDLNLVIHLLSDPNGNKLDDRGLDRELSKILHQNCSKSNLWLQHKDNWLKLKPIFNIDEIEKPTFVKNPQPVEGEPEC